MEEMNTMETQVKVRRYRLLRRIGIVVLIVLLAMLGAGYAFRYTTYDYVHIVKNYESESTDNGKYIQYIDGVLEYSRDGIAMLTKEGKELWNQACQMKSPIVEICNETAAVADQGGTSIYVFQKNGLKGEIGTTRPIEKITVSAQGIVAAVLQDEENPMVMCYDAKGNVLVEHKTSLKNTGYPVDLAISPDGNVLLVSYLCTKGNGLASKVSYYHFGEAGEDKPDHQVAQKEYSDTIVPTTVFLDKDTSMLVSDHALIFYEGLNEPKEAVVVELDKEIRSVAYNEKYVALVLKNAETDGYELRLYRTDGKQKMTADLDREYSNLKVADGQVLLFEENQCAIFNDAGVCKFQGTMEMYVTDIFPVTGFHKYMVINADGFQEIQLAK